MSGRANIASGPDTSSSMELVPMKVSLGALCGPDAMICSSQADERRTVTFTLCSRPAESSDFDTGIVDNE